MIWVLFAVGAVVFWGVYGPMLHSGQVQLGNPLRAFLCVGVAYFLIAVLFPLGVLWPQGNLSGFNSKGALMATLAGVVGALGALCIVGAFKMGGRPVYVMPLVFAGAPLINVVVSMWLHPPRTSPSPLLYAGFLLAALGAGMVLYFKPPS